MITVYKLTTQDGYTRKGEFNECLWRPGTTHSGTGEGDLCGPGYIHAYLSPILAVLLNPIHANIPYPKLWECSVRAIDKNDNNLKVGSIFLTTDREIELPVISKEQRVVFAILCSKEAQRETQHLFTGEKSWQIIYRQKMKIYNDWADSYLSGRNRDAAADAAAYAAASAAAYAAHAAAASAAAYAAASAAAYAARAAAYAAYAAYAAADAGYSARAAAYAAYAARASTIDFKAIAETAMSYT